MQLLQRQKEEASEVGPRESIRLHHNCLLLDQANKLTVEYTLPHEIL